MTGSAVPVGGASAVYSDGGVESWGLLTSRRQPAGLPGVRLLDLGALDQADALALLDRLCGDHRVAVDRAEAIPVVGFCGHLPLAIRVTGARTAAHRGWSLRRVARMLTTSKPDARSQRPAESSL